MIEQITNEQGRTLAYIVRADVAPTKTSFLTPNDLNFQMGFIVYPAGGVIQRHVHKPLERNIRGTNEVLVIREGRCEIDIFDDDKTLVATRELRRGDVMMMVAGGHGFRLLEDTIFLEIKQGPYSGVDEKERF